MANKDEGSGTAEMLTDQMGENNEAEVVVATSNAYSPGISFQ